MSKRPRKHFLTVSITALAFAFTTGCAFLTSPVSEPPRYDQVLVYDRPYDYTYLKTVEALDKFPNWILEETEKETGLLVLRNTQFGHLFDRDKEVARFRVRRVGPRQTSVALEPDSQALRQGGEFLSRIDATIAQAAVAEKAMAHSE